MLLQKIVIRTELPGRGGQETAFDALKIIAAVNEIFFVKFIEERAILFFFNSILGAGQLRKCTCAGVASDSRGTIAGPVKPEEMLSYCAFPEEHWRRIRTNNPLERILREIRRRTRVVGAFPDGQSALNLAAARLRYSAGTAWSTKRYLNIELLKDQQMRDAITA